AVSNLIRLLELPDEALELIDSEALSEGHGRALLLADGHAERRLLARQAAKGRWSVRQLEDRAREISRESGDGHRPRRSRRLHPDQEAAIEQISDALTEALGIEVEVAPGPGRAYRARLTFESLDAALDFARRLRLRAAA